MTKTVSYRGGIVAFSIPASWIEEYEPKGGATFYEDRPDSGTLRLNVLSFESSGADAARTEFKVFPSNTFELMQNGFQIRRYLRDAVENGEALHLHHWDVAVPVPPKSVRVVMFTHTMLASQDNDPRIKAELSLIENSVCQAVFSQHPGVAGDYQHDS